MLWRNRRRERDLEREMQSHLDLVAEEQRAAGLADEEARHAARRIFGNRWLVQEQVREAWGFARLESWKQDVLYGLRMLRKNPGFTAVAIGTLALGIGVNTALFSVVDAVLLNPLPYRDAGRLVAVWEENPPRGWSRNIVSAANFVDWRKQNHVFERMAAINEGAYNLSGTGDPVEVPGQQVTADFFPLLDVHAALGRTFTPDEDQPPFSSGVVLSHQLWKERYGGDPAVVGREVTINRRKFTVIGILPAAFSFPPWRDTTQRAQLWITGLDLRSPDRIWHNYESIGRLKPGVTFEQASVDMDTISRQLEAQYPEMGGWRAQLINLREEVVGSTRPALLVLIAAVGIVLLIACANLANLQLARVAAREKEIAVLTALGGGRWRVIRQLLTESLMLATIGGGLGVVLASWGVRLFVALGPQTTPGLDQAAVNLKVLAFTSLLSLMTGVLFGLVPALNASRVDVNQCFKESGRSASQGVRSGTMRSILVCAEFALALVLLAGAGLLIRSFVAFTRVDLGFNPHNVVIMRVALLGRAYADQPSRSIFSADYWTALDHCPG